jgi:hypothetical protein
MAFELRYVFSVETEGGNVAEVAAIGDDSQFGECLHCCRAGTVVSVSSGFELTPQFF